MRKILFTILFYLMLASSVHAGPSHFTPVDCKFDDGSTALTFKFHSTDTCSATKGAIAPDTDWFPENIGITNPEFYAPVRHTLQFLCPVDTVINVQMFGAGVTGVKVVTLNSGISIGANQGNQFSFILMNGITYNVQHKSRTQNCKLFIAETFSDDL